MNNKYMLIYLKNNKEFILDSPSMLVGRSDSCHIQVDVGNMSREHARIHVKDDGVYLQDLHSTNGTFVGGKRLSENRLLQPGDIIQFGEEEFSLQMIDNEVTIVGVPVQVKSKRAESSIVEDEDEEDSTMLFQAYQLPPGWSDLDGDTTDFNSKDNEAKERAIAAYVKKVALAFKGAKGLVMFFFVEDEPPSIRSVSNKEDVEKSWSFGRTESNDIVFRHQSISEKHGLISYSGGRWSIEDTDSTNGIWQDKNKVEKLELSDGLHFHVGTVEVRAHFVNH